MVRGKQFFRLAGPWQLAYREPVHANSFGRDRPRHRFADTAAVRVIFDRHDQFIGRVPGFAQRRRVDRLDRKDVYYAHGYSFGL